MTDTSFYERALAIGARIRDERKAMWMTQGMLADEIGEITGDKLIRQNTISDWERGITIPPINKLFALSEIFRCDCGYLLCDYDEKTHGQNMICDETGLAPESVQYLCASNFWGFGGHAASVLDLLIWDEGHTVEGQFTRSILSYLWFFFHFESAAGNGRAITCNGQFIDLDIHGYIDSAVNLNSDVLENAILLEMTDTLKHLKKTYQAMRAMKQEERKK